MGSLLWLHILVLFSSLIESFMRCIFCLQTKGNDLDETIPFAIKFAWEYTSPGEHNMLMSRIYAAHVGGFLGLKFSKQGYCLGMSGLSRI